VYNWKRLITLDERDGAILITDFEVQLYPMYPRDPEALLNEMKSPSELLGFGEF